MRVCTRVTIFAFCLMIPALMNIHSLFTLHLPKGQEEKALPENKGAFALETCLRHLGVCRKLPEKFTPGTQVFQGRDAYRFLLEVACGLHSKMQGESEIFGQIKQGWKQFNSEYAEEAKPLARLMQHLFADTKRIRSNYLHGLGGQSYAGATQKLLLLKKTDSILIIGAGPFGQMFAGKLKSNAARITIMNRSAAPLESLKAKWPECEVITGFDEIEKAIAANTHVLVCIPNGVDEKLDARIRSAWKKSKAGHLIHYGEVDMLGTEWPLLPRFHGLEEVVAVQNANSENKPRKIASAFAAVEAIVEERANGVKLEKRIQLQPA